MAQIKLAADLTGDVAAAAKAAAVLAGELGGLEATARRTGAALRDAMDPGQAVPIRKTLGALEVTWNHLTASLAARWRALTSAVGDTLMALLTPVLAVLANIVSALGGAVRSARNALLGLLYGGWQQGADQAVKGQKALSAATRKTAKQQKLLLASFDEMHRLERTGSGASGGGSALSGGEQAVKPLELSALPFFQKLQAAMEPVTAAALRLQEALRPFGQRLGEGLGWLWENVLAPMGAWAVNYAVPLFLDALAAALELFVTVWDMVKPGLAWLWEAFLKPVAEWTGGVIVQVLQRLVEGLKAAGDWCREHEAVVRKVGTALAAFAAAWVLVNGAAAVWNAVSPLAGGLAGALGLAMGGLLSPINLVALAIAAIIGVVALLATRFGGLKEVAARCWAAIQSVLTGAKNGIRGFFNGLIGYAEGFVNFFLRGINRIIQAFNAIHFTAPDWVPVVGGKTFGMNLRTLPELKLPRLARGAVIPPNREFLAVLGDQRKGTNIETPEALLRQVMREELGSGAILRELQEIAAAVRAGKVLTVDKRQLGRVVQEGLTDLSRAGGGALLPL